MPRERIREADMAKFLFIALGLFISSWRMFADICPGVVG